MSSRDWDHLQYEQRLQVNYCTRLQPFILVMNGPDHQLQYRRKILNIFCYSDLQYPGACGPLDSDLTGGSGLHKLQSQYQLHLPTAPDRNPSSRLQPETLGRRLFSLGKLSETIDFTTHWDNMLAMSYAVRYSDFGH